MENKDKNHMICEAVKRLKDTGINFLALDFDLTLISMHTDGKKKCVVGDVAGNVRPVFKVMLPLLMDEGIRLGIVTFNRNLPMVRDVLMMAFPKYSDSIVVRANCSNKDWNPIPLQGKCPYIASAAAECNNINITRATTLLIDDEFNNIDLALNQDIRALHFDPGNPDRIIADILELQ